MTVEDAEDLWLCNREDEKKLEEEYLFGEVIGRGSFSTIYKCLRKGRTEWACKILEKRRLNKALVKSEIPKLMKLKHPNIVRIKEVFEDQTRIQLIVDYVTGGEIFEKIVARGQYSEQDAAEAMRDMLSALQYLHGQGVVHGDIKPENLLYETESENSRLVMADFGLSQLFLDKGLIVNNIYGTVRYSAPEVLLGQETDFASDLWSLGVVMYIMLSGYEPFWDEDGEAETCKKIIQGEYSFASALWHEVSESAKDLITRLLSSDPKDRPTAEEALRHPWTRGVSTSSVPTDKMIKGLREYNARRRFRVASKAVLATRRAYNLVHPIRGDKDSSRKCECTKDTESSNRFKMADDSSSQRWPIESGNVSEQSNVQKLSAFTTR